MPVCHASTAQTRQTTKIKTCDRRLDQSGWQSSGRTKCSRSSSQIYWLFFKCRNKATCRQSEAKPVTSSSFLHCLTHKDGFENRAGWWGGGDSSIFTLVPTNTTARSNIWPLTLINSPTCEEPLKESSVWGASSSMSGDNNRKWM